MPKILVVFLCFVLLSNSNNTLLSQTFLNGSFENTTAGGSCYTNLSNSSFNTKMQDATAYGSGNEIDILTKGCYMPTILFGTYVIALAADRDEVSLTLSAQLQQGKSYTFTFYSYADTDLRARGDLELGLSSSKTAFGTYIYTAKTVSNKWVKHTVSFTAPINGDYIAVRNVQGPIHWNRIDNFEFTQCAFNVDLGRDTTLCDGEQIQLNATVSNATYVWNDSSKGPKLNVTKAGLYAVWVSRTGCTKFDSIRVKYNPIPSLDLGRDSILCDGDSMVLNATLTSATYLWNDNSKQSTLKVKKSGKYSVALNLKGCFAYDTVDYIFKPMPIVDLGNDTALCEGNTLVLKARNPGASYSWQDNSSSNTFNATTTGDYSVKVTEDICSASSSIHVDFIQVPVVNLGNDTALCPAALLMLNAGNIGCTYLWQNASTNQSFVVDSSGTYSVTVSRGPCSSSDAINVQYIQLPIVNLGKDGPICSGKTITLDASANNATYKWQDNSTQATYTVTKAGTYFVDLKIGTCMVSDSIHFTPKSLPTLDLGKDTIICERFNFYLYAGDTGVQYRWQNNSSASSFSALGKGKYWVSASNTCGTVSDTINIGTKECHCSLFIPNAFSPNDDFVNDAFTAVPLCPLSMYTLRIYDRWGALLFATDKIGEAWDGSYQNQVLPDGVYMYLIQYRFEDKIFHVENGTVHLLR